MKKIILLLPLAALLMFTIMCIYFDRHTKLKEGIKITIAFFFANIIVYLPAYMILF